MPGSRIIAALLAAAGRPNRTPEAPGRKAAEYEDRGESCQFARGGAVGMSFDFLNAEHVETVVKGDSEVIEVNGLRYIWFDVFARFTFGEHGNAIKVSVPVEISDDLTWAQLRQAALDGAKQTVRNAIAADAFGAERRRPARTKSTA
jgi:hypothetical protein